MINWNKLPIHKKFAIVFALQNTSLFLAWLLFDADFFFLFFLGFAFMGYFYGNGKKWTKKFLFIFSIITLSFWLLENNMILRTNVDIDYNKLNNYSGVTIHNNKSKSAHVLRVGSKSDNKYETFECSIGGVLFSIDDDCSKELRSYFGNKYSDTYNKNISVKHYRFYPMSIYSFNLIYEIRHNNETIFDYYYFINKYHQQQKNEIIYAIYLILSTFVFCIGYYLIQRNSVEHIQ